VYLSYEWAAHEPIIALTDEITMTWDTNEFLYSTSKSEFEFFQYCHNADERYITATDCDLTQNDHGLGITFDLAGHDASPVGGHASFKVFPKYGSLKDAGYAVDRISAGFRATYRHAPLFLHFSDLILRAPNLIPGLSGIVTSIDYLLSTG